MDQFRTGRVALSDPDLFSAAMAAAGYESTGRFAAEVLDVDPRHARRWKHGERELQGTVRVVCIAILARPAIALELKLARAELPPRNDPAESAD